MLLSNFIHRQQRLESDCLVACTQMVLEYLGVQKDYNRLRKILRSGPEFTPFGHLRYLEQLGLSVTLGMQSEVAFFENLIGVGLPIIVGVKTLQWSHWDNVITEHAVVVVGIDQEHDHIYIHDPYFTDAPLEMSLLEFQIGWEEKDRRYGIISLAPLGTSP